MADPITKIVKVTTTKVVRVTLTERVFGEMTHAAYLQAFRRGLWQVDSMDDVVSYAAELAACNSFGCSHDGIGRLEPDHHVRQGLVDAPPDTIFDVLSEEVESEITDQEGKHA